MDLIHATVKRFYPQLSSKESQEKTREVRNWCERFGVEVIPPAAKAYRRLGEIGAPPLALFVRGNSALLELAAVAVVGTRRPSPYGLRASFSFSAALARRGYVVVSGLAQGIDGAAHRGALLAGGYTIAVVGHGLDRVYPAMHRGLAREIVDKHGCIVSEYPPGIPPLKHHFPERNRILSGLSLGTLVIEAAERSGSLITAKFALEQNREVFVVPANFDDPNFRGSHWLIQQGAKLVTHPEHLADEFPPLAKTKTENFDEKTKIGLREIFSKNHGEMTLENLVEFSETWRGMLDRAIAEGLVAEISPQRYAWIGEEDAAFFHPAACQTGNDLEK